MRASVSRSHSEWEGELRNRNQQAAAHSDGTLAPTPEAVLVAWFEIPAESVFPGGPEHKIKCYFSGKGVRGYAGLPRMNPGRPGAQHKLRLFGERPRLLEQKVGVPFRRVRAKTPRYAPFEFQPLLDRRNLNGDRGAEAPSPVFDIPRSRSANFEDRGSLLLRRLREGGVRSREEKKPSRGVW